MDAVESNFPQSTSGNVVSVCTGPRATPDRAEIVASDTHAQCVQTLSGDFFDKNS